MSKEGEDHALKKLLALPLALLTVHQHGGAESALKRRVPGQPRGRLPKQQSGLFRGESPHTKGPLGPNLLLFTLSVFLEPLPSGGEWGAAALESWRENEAQDRLQQCWGRAEHGPLFLSLLVKSGHGASSLNSKGALHFLGGRGSWEGGKGPPLSLGLGLGQPVLSLRLGHAAGLGLLRTRIHSGSGLYCPSGRCPSRPRVFCLGPPPPGTDPE